MQLETAFLKYIPIFNWMGGCSVMTSDFRLANPSPTKRRLINMIIFVSFFLTCILSAVNLAAHIKNFTRAGATPHVVLLILYTFRINIKLSSIVHMYSWFNRLPNLYSHFKDIQRISKSRYKMDFRDFQVQFNNEASIVFSICLIKLIIYYWSFSDSTIECVLATNESIVLVFNHIIFFHTYFYVLLFKTLITFYIGYVERKALHDKPKNPSDLKVELIFIKIINFKLYETSKVLNAAFGWVFVGIFIQKFTEIFSDIFWTYGNHSCENIFDVIRNYN